MTLTREQIVLYNRYHNDINGLSNEDFEAAGDLFSRENRSAVVDALCNLALQAPAMQRRPIAEFDEHNPPDTWYIAWEDGVPNPMIFTEEGDHRFFGTDIPAKPTHFLLQSSLPKSTP